MTSRKTPRRQQEKEKRCDAPVGAVQDTLDQSEAEDGIMFQIREEELTIVSENRKAPQEIPGYSITIAIPNWSMNELLLNDVRKGFRTHRKMITRLQTGADRKWLMAQFEAFDKAMASSLSKIAERIRTRRWRKKKQEDSLKRLSQVFSALRQWGQKTIEYCKYIETPLDQFRNELAFDAACMSIIKVGELINQVERMQHEFWKDFTAAHFLEIRQFRNIIVHTEEFTEDRVKSLGFGIIKDLSVALDRTLFPTNRGSNRGGYLLNSAEIRALPPGQHGDAVTPENSIAMIDLNEHDRFVIRRVGRTDENKLLVSSSIIGRVSLSIHRFQPRPQDVDDQKELD